jgi:hypothetical protein
MNLKLGNKNIILRISNSGHGTQFDSWTCFLGWYNKLGNLQMNPQYAVINGGVIVALSWKSHVS